MADENEPPIAPLPGPPGPRNREFPMPPLNIGYPIRYYPTYQMMEGYLPTAVACALGAIGARYLARIQRERGQRDRPRG